MVYKSLGKYIEYTLDRNIHAASRLELLDFRTPLTYERYLGQVCGIKYPK